MSLQQWLDQMSSYLINNYGLNTSFAGKVALFIAYLFQYKLSPVITSGFRSPEYQEELIRRYEAGDKSIVVPPATNSKHSIMKFGKPASEAIDISTSNKLLAAQIANAIGIGAGYFFKTSDPVHFYYV